MKKVGLAVATLAFVLVSSPAWACGDSLYRVGKGVSYRVYSAPLPGNLLVYAPNEGAVELAEALARSGHGVHLVDSTDELQSELASGNYDVVIAPYGERDMVESATSASGKASYLPVALSKEDEKLAKRSYDRVMVPDKHELKHYLKAIHVALKSRA